MDRNSVMDRNRRKVFVAILLIWVSAILAGTGSATAKLQSSAKQKSPVEFISPDELKAKLAKNEPVIVVDVRSQNSYVESDKKIKGAIHSKARKVAWRLRQTSRDLEIVLYCACPADESSIYGAQELLKSGFKRVRVLKGGWNAWLAVSGQTDAKPKS